MADHLAVELVRARMRAASDLYGLGRFPDARAHLAAARAGFAPLEPRLARREPRLARELAVAFEALTTLTARGADRQRVRERMGPVADQLMEGALDALVPGRYRGDPGVQAAVLDGLLEDLDATYRRSAGGDLGARRARQRAFGLLDRAQATAQAIEESLGPQRDPVLDPLAAIRFEAYSGGLGPPRPPEDGEPPPPSRPPSPERVSNFIDASREALGRALR